MTDLVIERVNASFIRLYTEDKGIRQDISDHFTYPEPGFVRNKYTKWDGTTRLFKLKGNLLPYGLLHMLLMLAKQRGWSFELDDTFKQDISNVTRDELKEWVKTLDLQSGGFPIEPYDYQMEGLYLSIKYNRIVLLAATSAGKSLIAYMLARYYEMLCEEDGKKILIVVPSQMLVDQLFDDFKDYSSANGWDVNAMVHTIMQDRPKTARKMVYISTWQSIFEEDEEYFKVFGRVVVDEVHRASGKSITAIMDKCVGAHQRVGMTGTLKAEKCLHPDSLISMSDGTFKKIVDISIGDEVKTVNEFDGGIENKIVLDIMINHHTNQGEGRFKISVDDTELIITGNHMVMLSDGSWKRADQLMVGDMVRTIDGF
jgi:hypothetical protein